VSAPAGPDVEVQTDAEPSGLAQMLAGLIEANLARDPGRARLLRPSVVAIHAVDAGVAVTVRLSPARVAIANGGAGGRADVRIRAGAQDLLQLANAPLRLGLPDPLTPEGRAVLRGVLWRRVRISGMLRRPAALARFARLLSVA
jgi:hypothetical protein